jgi:hypothetical protein
MRIPPENCIRRRELPAGELYLNVIPVAWNQVDPKSSLGIAGER